VLLLIAGGSADAGVYEPMAARLAGGYTVVTHDPRGNSRSPLDGAWEDQRIEAAPAGSSRQAGRGGRGSGFEPFGSPASQPSPAPSIASRA